MQLPARRRLRTAQRPFTLLANAALLLACSASNAPRAEQERFAHVGESDAGTRGGDAAHTDDAGIAAPADALEARGVAVTQALEQADRSCQRDEDCALMEINTGCLPYCRVVAVSRARGADQVGRALRDGMDGCTLDAGSDPYYSSFWCSTRGFRAECRDQRCEYAIAPCSEGCHPEGDRCVGPPGAVCERCPPEASDDGPCAVLGQRCHYGECVGTAECTIDRDQGSEHGGEQGWRFTFVDCFR